jgi:opacity protein-like surface antigen
MRKLNGWRYTTQYRREVMKRILIGFVAALLLITFEGAVSAEEGAGVEIGLKMWLNQWTVSGPGAAEITSDSVMLLGPSIEVRFNNPFFAEASYLFSTSDYRFSDTGFKSDLQDANLAIGYMVIPGFGLVAGYRNQSRRDKVLDEKSTLDGPFLGVLGIAHVDESLSFYGKLNYLFTRFKGTDAQGGFREDSPGWSFEFGLKYALTKSFIGGIGYRYDTMKGVDTGVRDAFSGLTLSGMVAF